MIFDGSLVRRVALALAVVGALTFLLACYPSHPMSTFDVQGPVARSQLNLFQIIFWTAVVVFIAVEGALVYAVIRFRRKPGQGLPAQTHGNTRLEVAWTIAPALVLAVIAVPTVTTLFDLAEPPEGAEVLEIDVIGHQWWFEFQYPELTYADSSGKSRVLTTANELHIPVGTAVNLNLESADVIHSFWVPKLGGKTDVVPANVNTMWLLAEEPGIYHGQCAEFCGLSHALMRFRVIAEPDDAFQAWVSEQQAPAAVPEAGSLAAEGASIFVNADLEGRQRCVFCHTVRGLQLDGETVTIEGKVGPDLTHVGSRSTLGAGIMPRTDENLTAWLTDAPGVKPGSFMPQLGLKDSQVEALLAFLRILE